MAVENSRNTRHPLRLLRQPSTEHEGISYRAFGWVFFAAASLAFTGSGSFAGIGEFYRIKRKFLKRTSQISL